MIRNLPHFCAIFFLDLCFCLIVISCDDDDHFASFKDPRDDQTYHTLSAGGELWFAEDLRFEDSTLYSYQQALDACPPGWKLPTRSDWLTLSYHFGGYRYFMEEIGDPTAAYIRMKNEFGIEEDAMYWTSSPAWDDAPSIRSAAFRFSSSVEYTPNLVHSRMRCRCIRKEAPDDTGDIIQFKIDNQQKSFDYYRINYPNVPGQVNLFLHRKLEKSELLDRVNFHFSLPAEFVSPQDLPVAVSYASIEYQFSSLPEWNWFSPSAINSEDLEVLITFYNGSVVRGNFSGTSFDDVAITDGTFELRIN